MYFIQLEVFRNRRLELCESHQKFLVFMNLVENYNIRQQGPTPRGPPPPPQPPPPPPPPPPPRHRPPRQRPPPPRPPRPPTGSGPPTGSEVLDGADGDLEHKTKLLLCFALERSDESFVR